MWLKVIWNWHSLFDREPRWYGRLSVSFENCVRLNQWKCRYSISNEAEFRDFIGDRQKINKLSFTSVNLSKENFFLLCTLFWSCFYCHSVLKGDDRPSVDKNPLRSDSSHQTGRGSRFARLCTKHIDEPNIRASLMWQMWIV